MAKSLKTAPSLRNSPFFTIYITHLPTKKAVTFEGWVTEFQDNFGQTWNSETVYGRMDPLVTYQNTNRRISLGFDVVSDSHTMAKENLAKINQLVEFLYPVYEEGGRNQTNVLEAAPLLRLRWTNLISSAGSGQGLVGHMQGLNYAPSMTDGGFIHQDAQIVSEEEIDTVPVSFENPEKTDGEETTYEVNKVITRQYVPKTVSLSFEFIVLHNHLGGWYRNAAGHYVFGSDEINGKFPNQNAFKVGTQTDTKKVLTYSQRGFNVTEGTIDEKPAALADQQEILQGDIS